MSQQFAKAVRDKADEVARARRNVKRGRVLKVEREDDELLLTVELMTEDRVLDEDDLDVTQWVSWYDTEFGIKKNDTVLLMREGGEWTVTDVISDTKVARRVPTITGSRDGNVALTRLLNRLEGLGLITNETTE